MGKCLTHFILLVEKNHPGYLHPCPCGYYGDSQKPCTCAPTVVTKYQQRISGPLLDRIDIRIEVPRVDYEKLSSDRVGESSECIRARVQNARNIQQARFTNPEYRTSNNGSSMDIVCNADMRVGELRQFCRVGRKVRPDAGDDDAAQSLGAGLSPHSEAGADDCGSGGI